MSVEEVIRLLFSFLGGGLVAGLLDWLRAAKSERTTRRIEYINSQLRELYGPLQFYTSRNAAIFELDDSFQKAYHKEFIEKQWSEASTTQDRVNQWANQTIALRKEYLAQIHKNNERILEILENHYSLIEPDDAEILTRFVVDYVRMRTENDESGRFRTPHLIYKQVGDISFMRPEFINLIDKRFKEKKAELDRLVK